MKVSLKWLGEYVDLKLAPREVAEKLTMAGIEVKAVTAVGGWENVVVGEVMEVGPHPRAERLKLATVNLGKERLTVVCGAPNVAPGQKVPFARVGARLIDGHSGETLTLKPAKIRGVLSEGMVCSEKELGISQSHEGIMVLPPEAPLGAPLGEYLGDTILDLEVTPNRPDCLCIIGIAREVAALTGEKVHLPPDDYQEEEPPVKSLVRVDIAARDLCPRYCASLVRGVTIAPSPQWMQERLKSYGMRPINNVVDITNYVMLEYGQPLHAFDYDKLKGQRIIVRCAVEGEKMTSLDEVERELNEDILVIADEKEPVAIAGIMGGLDTEVTGKTTAILLEAANFDRATIRRGARHFQLPSEASIRFEKGLSRELPPVALKRATRLFQELAGGRVAKGVIDVYPGRGEAQGLLISTAEVKRLAGMEVDVEEMRRVLASLGFECSQNVKSPQITVTAPYWRSDITGNADLVEEVVRLIGYDKVPVTRLSATLPPQEPNPRLRLRERMREIMLGLGFQEVLTYSLVSLEKIERACGERETEPLKVANPMSREQEYLRPGLRPGLLAALAENQKSEQGGIRLFELGKVFLPRGKELPEEKEMFCAVLSGSRSSLSWRGEKGELDFYDAKGVVEALLWGLRISAEFKPAGDRSLSPCAEVVSDGDRLGVLGLLHPGVAEGFELSGTVCLVEIDVERVLGKPLEERRYAPVYRFPAVSRDIALVVNEEVGYQQVESIIRSFPRVTEVTLFDLYRGEQVARGKKSFAVRMVYQSPEHTLTDEEVNEIQQEMVDRLGRELGGKLRE